MRKKLLMGLLLGVVLTGCSSDKKATDIVAESEIVASEVVEETTESVETVEVETFIEVSEYPKDVTYADMSNKFREDGLLTVSMDYNGSSFNFFTGVLEDSQIVSVDVVNGSDSGTCTLMKMGADYYMLTVTNEESEVYKLTDVEIANLDDDLGLAEIKSPDVFSIPEEEVSSVIQVDDLSYVITDIDGYESDIVYDSEGYIESMSATQAELYTIVKFGTADDLSAELSSFKSNYVAGIETFTEMTYADAVRTFADAFLSGFMSMEQSGVETTEAEDGIDYEMILHDVTPVDIDQTTGYIYSVVENGVCIASNDLAFKCVVADNEVKARMYTYAGEDVETKQIEFETNAVELATRVVQ